MKAILLAAGLGTRLRPITDSIPKCLVPIQGRPLLMWWIDLLAKHGIDQLMVNTHYLANEVVAFVESVRNQIPLEVTVIYEEKLLGSAGTLKHNVSFIENEDVLVAYADNFTNANLNSFIEDHRRRKSMCTIGLFHSPRPSSCGIVELDENHRVVSFTEKPEHPKSDLANAGVYCFHPSVIQEFPDTIPLDLGFDVLPSLVGKSYGSILDGYLYDIGTVEAYFAVKDGVIS